MANGAINGPYDRAFYERIREGSARSARATWPLVSELLAPRIPLSVVDIGCGDGSWLAEAMREFNTNDIVGVDGGYVSRSGALRIPQSAFLACDLATQVREIPGRLGRRFDLATSLEVAEHLPAGAADHLVDALVQLAPVVLFSAAIPGQGGDSHVNEQWPDAWVRRFAGRGFRPVDELRFRIWNLSEVEFWYKQNLLLFASEEGLEQRSLLSTFAAETGRRGVPALVHPDLFAAKVTAFEAVRTLHSRAVFRAAAVAHRIVCRVATSIRKGQGR